MVMEVILKKVEADWGRANFPLVLSMPMQRAARETKRMKGNKKRVKKTV